MCAIFGFAAKYSTGTFDFMKLRSIALASESRGPHAWGVAYIRNNRLGYFKHVGRISHRIHQFLATVEGSQMVIGHVRWATTGDPHDHINNHPHPSDGGWLVHNGHIEYANDMNTDNGLRPTGECDSESIGLLAEQSEHVTAVERLGEALELAQCYSDYRQAHAVAWLGNRPSVLHILRAGKPLHLDQSGGGGTYFATVPDGFRNYSEIPDNTAISLRYRSGILRKSEQSISTVAVTDGNTAF